MTLNRIRRQLLQAASHQWGPGKIHLLTDDSSKTLCGKSREHCPGEIVYGVGIELTCLVCQRAVETEVRNAEYQRQWERQEREREEARRQRKEEYSRYLETPEWRRRRALVLKRAGGICEGCGKAGATQAHHLNYDRIFHEMLFDLVAICDDCHRQIHQDKNGR